MSLIWLDDLDFAGTGLRTVIEGVLFDPIGCSVLGTSSPTSPSEAFTVLREDADLGTSSFSLFSSEVSFNVGKKYKIN